MTARASNLHLKRAQSNLALTSHSYSNKLSKIYPMCVLKFKTICLANFPAVRLIRPTFEHVLNANSEIVIDSIYTDGPDSTNDITIQFISHGTLSLQHSNGETTHARHVSGCMRRHVGGHVGGKYFSNKIFS